MVMLLGLVSKMECGTGGTVIDHGQAPGLAPAGEVSGQDAGSVRGGGLGVRMAELATRTLAARSLWHDRNNHRVTAMRIV
jgi:hypothetical protein